MPTFDALGASHYVREYVLVSVGERVTVSGGPSFTSRPTTPSRDGEGVFLEPDIEPHRRVRSGYRYVALSTRCENPTRTTALEA